MRLELRSLEDRTAVITGGGGGVGAAVAVALAEAGADVYLIGRGLNKLAAAKAREFGVKAAVQAVDISTNSGQLQAVHRVKADLTHLDILVLNTATFAAAPIDSDLSDFDKLYQNEHLGALCLDASLVADAESTAWTSRLHQFEQWNCSKADDGAV